MNKYILKKLPTILFNCVGILNFHVIDKHSGFERRHLSCVKLLQGQTSSLTAWFHLSQRFVVVIVVVVVVVVEGLQN